MRSKTTVVLAIVGGMVALFAVGVLWRVFRPSAVERTMRELPAYPGARDVGDVESAAQRVYAGNPQGEVRFAAFLLPRGISGEEAVRWYRTHKPPDWRRVGPRCYARGKVRVILLPQTAREFDVMVADNARCP